AMHFGQAADIRAIVVRVALSCRLMLEAATPDGFHLWPCWRKLKRFQTGTGEIMKTFRELSFVLLLCAAGTANALDKITFLTNWFAEAEHGGYYQAVAEGIYEKYGLDVKIGMGGPQVNVYQLLLAEKADFVMGYDVATINAVEQNLPLITVAANFQSEPVGLIAHPDVQKIE